MNKPHVLLPGADDQNTEEECNQEVEHSYANENVESNVVVNEAGRIDRSTLYKGDMVEH